MDEKTKEAWQLIGLNSLIIVGVFFILRYFYRVIYGGSRVDSQESGAESKMKVTPFTEFYLEGIAYLDQNNYFGALDSFEKCLMIATCNQEKYFAHNGLGRTYYMMTDYEEAINQFNKSLELVPIAKTENYELRSICYEGMKRYKEALSDILLHDVHRTTKDDTTTNNSMKMRIESLLDEYAREKATEHTSRNYLPPSQTNCRDFFDTFVGIIPQGENDVEDVAYLLEHHQYEKLYEYFLGNDAASKKIQFIEKYKSNKIFSYEILLASIHYIMGDSEASVLENPKSELEVIFKEFTKRPLEETQEEFNKLNYKDLDNPTVKFWLAKTYRKAERNDLYLQIMNSMKDDHYFVYCDLLAFFAKNGQENEFIECSKEARRLFPDNSCITLLVFDYYFNLGDKDKIEEIIKEMKTNDSRSFMMRGQYFGMIGDSNAQIDCYNQAIDKDNTFYIGYVYLAEYYKGNEPEKFRCYLNQALRVAPTQDDLLWCYKQLLFEECKEETKGALVSN